MKVLEVQGPMLVTQVQNDGKLGARKSVNVPGEHIDLPALTEKDRSNILFAIEQDIDFIAHSFVRSAEDVHAVQKFSTNIIATLRLYLKLRTKRVSTISMRLLMPRMVL